MKKIISLIIFAGIVILPHGRAWGQEVVADNVKNERRADSLCRVYEFARASQIYSQMAQTASPENRKRLELKAICCQNGEAMLHYVSSPKVVMRKTLDRKDFFLYYPDISSLGHFISRQDGLGASSDTIFVPDNKNTLYYSAQDGRGVWNIYVSKKQGGGVWSAPQILGSNVTSGGNDIFPFVSADGKRLYFSSNGHYGAGGYDLYVSYWDEDKQDWGVAQNMGFPYSSPGDDLFFYITPDGKHAAFSSTRMFDAPESRLYNNSRIVCYVVEYEAEPLKYPASPKDVYNIARLSNTTNLTQNQRDSISRADIDKALKGVDRKTGLSEMDPATRQITQNYTKAVLKYGEMKKQREGIESKLSSGRSLYAAVERRLAVETDSLEREIKKDSLNNIAKKLTDSESLTLSVNSEIREAEREIRKTEEVFLASGVYVPENTLFKTSEELAGETENSQKEEEVSDFSAMLDKKARVSGEGFLMERAKPSINLAFTISKKSVVADMEDFPDGLRFQIKLTTSQTKLGSASFKGISPVFERKDGERFTYCAGAFESYSEASRQLQRVKKAGFAKATIVAFNDGRAIPLVNARKMEAAAYNVIVPTEESSLEPQLMKILSSSGKDIAKVASSGGFKFIVGPFPSIKEANVLANKLKDISDKKISVEAVY